MHNDEQLIQELDAPNNLCRQFELENVKLAAERDAPKAIIEKLGGGGKYNLESMNKSFPTSMTDAHSKKPVSHDEPKANMIPSASTTNPSVSTINAPVFDSNAIDISPSKLPPNMPAPLDTITSASTTNASISHAGNVITPSLLPNMPASSSFNIQNSTTDVPSTNLTAKVLAGPSTRKVRMRPGPARTGRNLAALRWLKQIQSDGTTPEFKDYYDGVSKDQRQAYDNKAKDLVAKNMWNKAKDVQDGTLH